ncbi:hypothetical protein A6779_16030 [Marinobacter adhaerens]|uniref:DUF4007 domain-containing protein n=1 Tax=Marinobacter salsuginis TaxID=418719 RepID=A0A5M3PS22_9GAMM|nr:MULTISPECIES: DUF4007 family protein [Marinobacter]ODM28633.1 hypothetical protein A6779_16030 [Marinobacter adhaerens]GBO85529.1 hypothetical protein MS5N3_29800 [Marinobacter salsuginis]
MARGPLYQQDYNPQFSGHETFPLRYGWLKKCFDRVSQTEHEPGNKPLCWGDDAIARFGVGKNMVASMRHWATVAGIIEEPTGANQVKTTQLGQLLFGDGGLDPYLENPNSLWLIHWKLATEWKKKTTWYWAFSHYSAVTFERDKFVERLQRDWPKAAKATVKNDVACFLRTYAVQPSSSKAGRDDSLECPLTELGLIKPVSKRDEFRFVRGQKTTLGNGTFVYALLEFWKEFSPTSSTLSFEAIAHEPGSPGRLFLLDENDVADRLFNIDSVAGHALRWSETAGLKQVIRSPNFDFEDALDFIRNDFESSDEREAAQCL